VRTIPSYRSIPRYWTDQHHQRGEYKVENSQKYFQHQIYSTQTNQLLRRTWPILWQRAGWSGLSYTWRTPVEWWFARENRSNRRKANVNTNLTTTNPTGTALRLKPSYIMRRRSPVGCAMTWHIYKKRYITVREQIRHAQNVWSQGVLGSPGRWMQHGPLKRWYPTTTLHGVTTQKTSTSNSTTVKASKPASLEYVQCNKTVWNRTCQTTFYSHFIFFFWPFRFLKWCVKTCYFISSQTTCPRNLKHNSETWIIGTREHFTQYSDYAKG
jgi:hypothetical protein